MNQQHSNYTLWLRPQQSEVDNLTRLISKLSNQHQTRPFPPHITLLSSCSSDLDSMKQVCKSVSETQSSFTVNLQGIEYTENYFRNLFILAENNAHLMKIHNRLKEKLKTNDNEVYMLHISLLYGKLDEPKQQELKFKLADSIPKTVHCNRIDIYNCAGNESQWNLEESFTLK